MGGNDGGPGVQSGVGRQHGWQHGRQRSGVACAVTLLAVSAGAKAAQVGDGEVYQPLEISFAGPSLDPSDAPARDVDFWVRFRHESGAPEVKVYGFWDGDGRGGERGGVFRVRFCPTRAGRWSLAEVHSNRRELRAQKQGGWVSARPSSRPGFWEVDGASPGRRWYQRSDGSHPYVFGNTMYSFLSEQDDRGPSGSSIARDVRANALLFKKIRFSVHGDRYPHPQDKPFLDDAGRPTESGDFSHRPSPRWFHDRVDLAVKTAFDADLIADLILNGPDIPPARSILRAGKNGGDATPYLRYIAARYGSYPNVWLCLSNEWDIKSPKYTPAQVARLGAVLRGFLPYPTPLSIHGVHDWNPAVNTRPAWNDHVIVQHKIKALAPAAEAIARNYALGLAQGGGPQPVANDELAYEGAGDGWSEGDVIESHLGAFLGGGYASTGYKPASKKGHYFWGRFDPEEHRAADNLAWLRRQIDGGIAFWKMQPVPLGQSIFARAADSSRAMAWDGNQYVLGTDKARAGIQAALPPGTWRAESLDAIAMRKATLSEGAAGTFTFDAPDSRAVLFVFTKK